MNRTIRIYPASYAEICKASAGQKYKPSNGAEGEIFFDSWCGQCQRDKSMREGAPLEECDDGERCDIIARSFHDIHSSTFPTEWQYGPDGQPRCTAFVEAGQPIPVKDEHTLDLFSTEGGAA